ncbi:unnamed protein product, partial [Rotaria sp. Silwood1]
MEANAVLNQYRSSTSRTFVGTFDLIRNIAQGNGIMSSTLSNWYFPVLEAEYTFTPLWTEPRSYDTTNCSCGTNATCSEPAIIDGWHVPGFRIGCSPFEALLQSTLECLYNTILALRILIPIPVKIGLKVIQRYRQRRTVGSAVATINRTVSGAFDSHGDHGDMSDGIKLEPGMEMEVRETTYNFQ